MRSTSIEVKRSAIRRSTIAREVAVHFWPVLIIAPLTTCNSA